MAVISKGLERITTLILATAIGILAVVLGLREFAEPGADPELSDGTRQPPVFVETWKDLQDEGIRVGNSTAPVHLTEFIDFQCPVCATEHPIIMRLRQRFGAQLAVNYVHLPLHKIHPFAISSAHAVECADRSGNVDAFIDVLFAKQDSLGLRSWDAYRRDAGIDDSATFASCMALPTPARIADGEKTADAYRVSSTPTIIINGWRFQGTLSEEGLTDVVTRLLRNELPRGVIAASNANAAGSGAVPTVRITPSDLSRAPQVSISAVPMQVMGRDETEALDLSRVTSVAVLGDGRVVTFSGVGAEALIFGPDGHLLRRLARKGRGPGELMRPSNVARIAGDSLVLLDAGNLRMYWGTPDAGIVRERSLRKRIGPRTDLVAGELPGGRLVIYDGPRVPPVVSSDRPIETVATVSVLAESSAAVSVAEVPNLTVFRAKRQMGGQRRDGVDVLRLSGRAHIVVWDTLIATASGGAYRITVRNSQGAPVVRIELERPRRLVTRAMRDGRLAMELDQLQSFRGERPVGPAGRAESERFIRSMRFADSLPALESMYVAPDQTLWVVDAIGPGDTEWSATAFRLNGWVVGRLHAKDSGVPVAFGADRVVIRETRADGTVILRTHRIVPSEPR